MQEVVAEQELFRNIAIGISMLLFVIFGISRIIYPKLFASIYSFDKFLVLKYREDFGSGIRLFSTESFYFTGVLSLNFSFSLLCIYLFTNQFEGALPWLNISTYGMGLLLWLAMALAIQFLFFLKFLFIQTFGWLFDIPLQQSRHFQEFQGFNHSFSLLVFLILTISIYIRFSFPLFSLKLLAVLIAIYLFLRLINLFFKIRSSGAYSNLYIFSYLCSTELMPTLVALYLII